MPIDLGMKPLFQFEHHKVVLEKVESINPTTKGFTVEPAKSTGINLGIDFVTILGIALLSISLLLFIRFLYRFGSIILIQTSGNRLENDEGLSLIFTDKTDNAFSFLGNIFINPLKFTDEEKRLIIEHEREHIRHFHSVDLIIIELLIVFQWFNPFAYIARRKLIEIHEFIADNGVISKGADPYSYQSLLLSVVTSSCLPSAGNQLSAFITKKRIAMIGKPMNQTGKWINFLILIPVAAALVFGVSAFTSKEPISTNSKTDKPINFNQKDNNISWQEALAKRAEEANKDTYLKDLYFNLPSSGSTTDASKSGNTNRYSVILKKGVIYNLYYFSGSKDDRLTAIIGSGSGDESVIEQQFNFSYFLKKTFEPKTTGAYHLEIDNQTSKKAEVLIYLTLSGYSDKGSEATEQQTNSLEFAKKELSQNKNVEPTDTTEQVFMVVEKMPIFGNKEEDFRTWVASTIQYPKEAAAKKIQGKVFVQFVVEKDGSITNAKILRSIDPLLDKEAIRVVQASPKWTPGMQGGKPVRVSYTFPITFTLQ